MPAIAHVKESDRLLLQKILFTQILIAPTNFRGVPQVLPTARVSPPKNGAFLQPTCWFFLPTLCHAADIPIVFLAKMSL